jgi:hypothetical protein
MSKDPLAAVLDSLVPVASPWGDWADVIARASDRSSLPPVSQTRPSNRTRFRGHAVRWRQRTAIFALAGLLAVALATGAVAHYLLSSSPGFSSGLSALEQLPTTTWPATMPAVSLERAAGAVGITPDQARSRLRLLQSGLSLGGGRLYAFEGRPGTACIFLEGRGGSCLTPQSALQTSSVMPAILSGYPGQPSALVALVADDVKRIDLDAGNRVSDLPIVNNSIYVDLGNVDGSTVTLVVHFADGETKDISLPSP